MLPLLDGDYSGHIGHYHIVKGPAVVAMAISFNWLLLLDENRFTTGVLLVLIHW